MGNEPDQANCCGAGREAAPGGEISGNSAVAGSGDSSGRQLGSKGEPDTAPLTAVVIPYYSGEQFIGACVRSVLENGIPGQRIYVVDNSIRESAGAVLQPLGIEVNIIRTKPRIGFGRACNAGARAALTQGVTEFLILNQDTILDSGCMEELVRVLRSDSTVSIAAPLNYTYDFAGIEPFLVRHFISQCPSLLVDALRGATKETYDVESVPGSCFLIRSDSVVRLGLFDELFFMYVEDDDLCRRYRMAGRRIVQCPKARVAHAHGHTASREDSVVSMWEREADRLYELKNITHPFVKCLGRVMLRDALDYLKLGVSLSLPRLCRTMWGDLRCVWKLRQVLRSRKTEATLLAGMSSRRQAGSEGVAAEDGGAMAENSRN